MPLQIQGKGLDLGEVAELFELGGHTLWNAGQGHLDPVALEGQSRQQLHAHDAVWCRHLRVPGGSVGSAPASSHPRQQPGIEVDRHLGVLVDRVIVGPVQSGTNLDRDGRSGQHERDRQRMHAEVEQHTAAPGLGEEVAPGGAGLKRPHLHEVDGVQLSGVGDRESQDRSVQEVLGVGDPGAGVLRRHEHVGISERGAERLLDQHAGVAGEGALGMLEVQRRGRADDHSVSPGRELGIRAWFGLHSIGRDRGFGGIA